MLKPMTSCLQNPKTATCILTQDITQETMREVKTENQYVLTPMFYVSRNA